MSAQINTNAAWARFLRSVAAAANQLAADLEAVDQGGESARPPDQSPESLVIGKRQQAILAVPGLREEAGVKTADIARSIGSPDVPNVYLAMRALEKRGVVELVPNRRPQYWRLAARFLGATDS